MAARKRPVSIKRIAKTAVRDNAEAAQQSSSFRDSFQNFALSLGIGTDNPLSQSTYGYNPITKTRVLLEWIHRGSWLGGVAIDLVGDDMTRAGVDFTGDIDPDDSRKLDEAADQLGIWAGFNDNVRWSRLYGGSIAVPLLDGQDMSKPLQVDRVGRDQFKGLYVMDRWMVNPSMEELVDDFGPQIGMPKYYTVNPTAPALRGKRIHYTRVFRMEGIKLPYWQRITENLWGLSVIERLYDRMIAFDSATTGAAQLVYKSFLRTLKLKDFRKAVAYGGPALDGVLKSVAFMRQMQSQEGVSVIDMEDDLQVDDHGSFSGIAEALGQFGQQLSGALQIPLVRLFGQSPAGMNSTGESDLRTYYDGIKQQQNKTMKEPVTITYRLIAASRGIKIPEGFGCEFRSLWQLTDKEKADTAKVVVDAVSVAFGDGTITHATALKELKQSSDITGIFSNITDEEIKDAEDAPVPLPGEKPGPLDLITAKTAQQPGLGGGSPAAPGTPGAKPNPTGSSVVPFKRASTADQQGGGEWHGIPYVIETRKGDVRTGAWGSSPPMPADYGYILATSSAEGEREGMDIFIGPDLDSKVGWIIYQKDLDTGDFDEHKVMAGYRTQAAARADYVSSFSDGRGEERILYIERKPAGMIKKWVEASWPYGQTGTD